MNSIRLGVFDIFAYIVPGIVYIVLISLALNFITPEQLINEILSLSLYSLLGYFFLGYLISFALENISSRYFYFTVELIKGNSQSRVIEKFKKENPDAKINEYRYPYTYAFVDVYSPISREKADNFSALAKMARNLSFGFLIFAILTILFSFIHFSQVNWLRMLLKVLIALIISIIFSFNADRYNLYFHIYLLNTYHIISKNADKIESPKKPKDRKS